MKVVSEKRWKIAEQLTPEMDALLEPYHPVLRQLLFNRGITDIQTAETFLDIKGPLYDPFLMKDMRPAVERLLAAIDHKENIIVYGDYDVDGVTSTVLLVEALRQMGAQADGYIPNRYEEGYGLNFDALSYLVSQDTGLVITVDCGIRSPKEVAYAVSEGLDVIVTDHHEPDGGLPPAHAVVCPKQEGDEYPDKNLAGVGLTFKLVQALLLTRPVPGVSANQWLDLVAVGTVADVVPLVDENRALVKAGLGLLSEGTRLGLRALAGAAGISLPRKISARDIGFTFGPRLNAAGRVDSALAAYHLLINEDAKDASLLAQKLDDQNKQRQLLTQEIQFAAEAQAINDEDHHLLFAFGPEDQFKSGVVGLAAARLTETFYRPAVVASQGEEFTRASCRSIPEFHITHALDACGDLMVRHGGHSMAAGFTVQNDRLEELINKLQDIADHALSDQDLQPVVRVDKEIDLGSLSGEDIRMIFDAMDKLEPTGMDNPDVAFVSRGLKVIRHRLVGSDQRHLKLTVQAGGKIYDAIAFRQGHWAEKMPAEVDLLYSFEMNHFQGRDFLQLNVKDIKASNGFNPQNGI